MYILVHVFLPLKDRGCMMNKAPAQPYFGCCVTTVVDLVAMRLVLDVEFYGRPEQTAQIVLSSVELEKYQVCRDATVSRHRPLISPMPSPPTLRTAPVA